MSTVLESFLDRRTPSRPVPAAMRERRQFVNSHAGLSLEAQQLANAIDGYKLRHRRRYIGYEEMLAVITSLGYRQVGQPTES